DVGPQALVDDHGKSFQAGSGDFGGPVHQAQAVQAAAGVRVVERGPFARRGQVGQQEQSAAAGSGVLGQVGEVLRVRQAEQAADPFDDFGAGQGGVGQQPAVRGRGAQ